MKIKLQVLRDIDFEVEFPFYRSRLIGEYGISGFEKTYWKFESVHKVIIIIEKMCETSVITYDDKQFNFFTDFVNEDMLYGNGDYEKCPEKFFNACVDRLVTKLAKAI